MVKRGVKFINSDSCSKASANAPAKRFAQSNRYILPIRLLSFITGVAPQTPNAEGIYKKEARVKPTDKRLESAKATTRSVSVVHRNLSESL